MPLRDSRGKAININQLSKWLLMSPETGPSTIHCSIAAGDTRELDSLIPPKIDVIAGPGTPAGENNENHFYTDSARLHVVAEPRCRRR